MDNHVAGIFLKSLFEITNVPVGIFNEENDYIGGVGHKSSKWMKTEKRDMPGIFRERALQMDYPCLYVDGDDFVYGIYIGEDENLYVCGPAFCGSEDRGLYYKFYQTYGKTAEDITVPHKSYPEMANILALLYIGIEQKEVESIKILSLSEAMGRPQKIAEEEHMLYVYKKSFDEKQHYGQYKEDEYCKMVEEGDLDAFLVDRAVGNDAIDLVGDLAKNSRKNLEYMFVSALTLARTAAVRGGMDYLVSCDLSDLYLRSLETCHSGDEILALLYQMRLDYVKRVHSLKNNADKSGYVEFCKDEITRNITKPFNRQKLADMIGVNADYLSALFSEKTGMTLTQYRLQARLTAASNLLKYSDYSISDISERFLFASPSAFSKYFKKQYGVTPKKYREKNQSFKYQKKG